MEFSKKIKKEEKNKKMGKIKYRGEEYKIDNWAQCDKCNIWRKIARDLKTPKTFRCRDAAKKCHVKEKI